MLLLLISCNPLSWLWMQSRATDGGDGWHGRYVGHWIAWKVAVQVEPHAPLRSSSPRQVMIPKTPTIFLVLGGGRREGGGAAQGAISPRVLGIHFKCTWPAGSSPVWRRCDDTGSTARMTIDRRCERRAPSHNSGEVIDIVQTWRRKRSSTRMAARHNPTRRRYHIFTQRFPRRALRQSAYGRERFEAPQEISFPHSLVSQSKRYFFQRVSEWVLPRLSGGVIVVPQQPDGAPPIG